MTYALSWYTADEVLLVELCDSVRNTDYVGLAAEVDAILQASPDQLDVIFDLRKMEVTYETQNELKALQDIVQHTNIYWVYFISDNKLKRLVVLLAFGLLGQINLTQYQTFESLVTVLERRGFMEAHEVL